MILFGAGFVGITIIMLGFITIIGRRISEPKRATQSKINQLEKEIENLKSSQC